MSKFSKNERLASKKLIQELFSKGSSFFLYPFKTFYILDHAKASSQGQVLISIPKKIFKSAVKRNKIKRRIKEAYRFNKQLIQNNQKTASFLVGFVYLGKDILPFTEIETKLKIILNRLTEHDKSQARPK